MVITTLLALFALQAPPAAVPPVPPPSKKDPIICRGGRDLVFGSHMSSGRDCRRKSEWDDQARDARRELKQINERGLNPAPVPGARPIE